MSIRNRPDANETDYPRPPPGEPTGIKMVIVGAGLGGLACAIESRLVGHDVLVLEQAKAFHPYGDNIGLFPNSGRFLKQRWGIHHEVSQYCAYTPGLYIRKYDGDLITFQEPRLDDETWKNAPLYDTTRAELHEVMLNRARELGAEVRMGTRVLSYHEDESGATVEVNGETFKADVVIGADGVKSKARELVLGYYDAPKPSGYAIFRAAYDADRIRENPVCAHLAPKGSDERTVWIGPDIHFIHGTSMGGKRIHWLLTHLDTADVEESWQLPGKMEDALEVVKGWDPVMSAVIETTPPGLLIDWKLVYRDPLPSWVSDNGRICIMGDAAHPFLPTSQQGASQAVEDGVTIAHTLKLAKDRGMSLSYGLKTFQAMRYDRVRRAQQLGVDNRNMWHKVDYSKPIDPESIKLPFALWLWDHDAVQHAHDNFDAAVKEVDTKSPAMLATGKPAPVPAVPVAPSGVST